MKTLSQITPEEKIKMFDSIYQKCLKSFHEGDQEDDMLNFYEGVIGDVLGTNLRDWLNRDQRLKKI